MKLKPKKRRSLKDRAYDWYSQHVFRTISYDLVAELAWIAGYRSAMREKGKK